MSRLVFIFSMILAGLVVAMPQALAAKSKRVAKAKAQPKSELQTDVKFDDSVLHGQYQVPDEALAKVENEKVLSDLLGVRKHFKDRLLEAREQE